MQSHIIQKDEDVGIDEARHISYGLAEIYNMCFILNKQYENVMIMRGDLRVYPLFVLPVLLHTVYTQKWPILQTCNYNSIVFSSSLNCAL